MFKRILDEYFAFNHQQRKGLFVLACLSLFLFFLRLSLPMFIQPGPISIRQLPVLPISATKHQHTLQAQVMVTKAQSSEHKFMFNPNHASKEELLALGFSEGMARHLLTYRRNGLVFKQAEDLSKVFGMDESFLHALAPYVDLHLADTTHSHVTEALADTGLGSIDLNTVRATELVRVPGMDAGMVQRVLKYRARLGGYIQLSQLCEVFGFEPSLLKTMATKLKVDRRVVQKINPNKASLFRLRRHPYIGDSLASLLVRWRKRKALATGDIKKLVSSTDMLEKLKPYLIFR